MPYATALTPVVDAHTTIFLPASKTKPVLSRTWLAANEIPYSMYSAVVGVAELAIAILTVTADEFLFTTFTVVTANVEVGTVYSVVFVVADKSAVPNLPVAIYVFSIVFIYLIKKFQATG